MSRVADQQRPGHDPARRVAWREHCQKIYERTALDQRLHPGAIARVAVALRDRFGDAAVRERSIPPKEQDVDFTILLDDGQISTSTSESTIYADFKPATVGVVLIDPEKRKEARKWLLESQETDPF
jgi:hypothetical protein